MSILEKAKIGNSVKVNLKLSKDRLPKEVVDAANGFQTNIFSHFFNLRADRLAGNTQGKYGKAFIEALKSSKKFEYDLK